MTDTRLNNKQSTKNMGEIKQKNFEKKVDQVFNVLDEIYNQGISDKALGKTFSAHGINDRHYTYQSCKLGYISKLPRRRYCVKVKPNRDMAKHIVEECQLQDLRRKPPKHTRFEWDLMRARREHPRLIEMKKKLEIMRNDIEFRLHKVNITLDHTTSILVNVLLDDKIQVLTRGSREEKATEISKSLNVPHSVVILKFPELKHAVKEARRELKSGGLKMPTTDELLSETLGVSISYIKELNKISKHEDITDIVERLDQGETIYAITKGNIRYSEPKERIFSMIESLPELYREIMKDRELNGMKYEDISEKYGLDLNTVKTRIKRAREKMETIKNK